MGKLVSTSPFSVGNLTEETLETQNKWTKKALVNYTFKGSVKQMYETLYGHLLMVSDPRVTKFMKVQQQESSIYPKEIVHFLREINYVVKIFSRC